MRNGWENGREKWIQDSLVIGEALKMQSERMMGPESQRSVRVLIGGATLAVVLGVFMFSLHTHTHVHM